MKHCAHVSEYASENLMYDLIRRSLAEHPDAPLDVLVHHPLVYLVSDRTALSEEENRFIDTGMSHLDFLIFNTVTKQPVLAIEVDGVSYHKECTKQADRDHMKDHILDVNHIKHMRFKTNGSKEEKILSDLLDEYLRS